MDCNFHYYNFDYENNKLKKIEGYDKEGLGITYKAEIDANDNLTSFSSFNAKGAKSDYYKMILFDNGMLKCEHRYSPTDEELYKYDYTYNDNVIQNKMLAITTTKPEALKHQ